MLKTCQESEIRPNGFSSFNRKHRTILMDDYLRKIGLKRKLISRDASCLFRAVSEQVFFSQGSHLQIRQACVRYLERHRAEFQGFVDIDYDDYLIRLSDTNEAASQLEISAISQMYKHDFIIYQYPEQEPENVTANGFDKYIYLCFSGRSHYDCVYPVNYFDSYAVCQSIVYELLLEKVFKKPKKEVTGSVNTLRLLRMSSKLKENANNEEECPECLPENIFQQPHDLLLPPSIGFPDKDASLLDKSCWTFHFPMALDVVRALDPSEYRNTEYDMWMKVKRKQQHIDFSLSVGIPYNIGDKCLVYLAVHGKTYIGHVQEVSPNLGPITVFIEELGFAAMHTLALLNVSSFEHGCSDKNGSSGHSSKGKMQRKSSRTRSKSSSYSSHHLERFFVGNVEVRCKKSWQKNERNELLSPHHECNFEQGFDPKRHVHYVIKNKLQNMLATMQDGACGDANYDNRGMAQTCTNKQRCKGARHSNTCNYQAAAQRSLSYSDISGGYYDLQEPPTTVEQIRTRQRTTSEAWNKEDFDYEEEYNLRCQSMENLSIKKGKKGEKSQRQKDSNLEDLDSNENLHDDIPSNSSCEKHPSGGSSWGDQHDDFNEASFSSPELTGTIESAESSQVHSDPSLQPGQQYYKMSEVMMSQENGYYMQQQPMAIQMQSANNMPTHYMNVQQPYNPNNMYHTIQDSSGSYITMPVIGGSPLLHPGNTQIVHHPPPTPQCFNVVDSEGKDLNFFVQLGMEYYRHSQLAASPQMVNNPTPPPMSDVPIGSVPCPSTTTSYQPARVHQFTQPIPTPQPNPHATFVAANPTHVPQHYHSYPPQQVFYVVPSEQMQPRIISPQQ